MDILLVEDLIEDAGLHHVREACVDIFTVRGKHSWPPTVTVYKTGRNRSLRSRENGFTPEGVDEAAAELAARIGSVDAADDGTDAASRGAS